MRLQNLSKMKNAILLSIAVSCTVLSLSSFAQSEYGPGNPKTGNASVMYGVTEEMLSADAWAGSPEYKKVLLTPDEIRVFNEKNFAKQETNMTDLLTEPDSFDGVKLLRGLQFEDPKNLYLNDAPVPASYYASIRSNINKISVSESMPVQYGIAINRTLMKMLPYADLLSDGLGDPDWDNLASSSVLVNEPVLVYLTTADGKYAYIKSEICSGWVPFEDIVLCHSKEEWIAAQTHTNFLVVTGESVTTEPTAANKAHSEKSFDMGTVLELSNGEQSVDNRMSWYSYTVMIPGKGADGRYELQKALIPMNRDVHVGFLPLTQENVIRQSMKCLGNRYGWGGMLDSQDCSSFVREVYLVFGMKLPRNTTWQALMPVTVVDVSEMNDSEKTKAILAAAPGSILQFPGHEMLYLGQKNGDLFTINNVSSLVLWQSGEAVKYRARSVVINGLNQTWRANGKTWLQALTKIIIPWQLSLNEE